MHFLFKEGSPSLPSPQWPPALKELKADYSAEGKDLREKPLKDDEERLFERVTKYMEEDENCRRFVMATKMEKTRNFLRQVSALLKGPSTNARTYTCTRFVSKVIPYTSAFWPCKFVNL